MLGETTAEESSDPTWVHDALRAPRFVSGQRITVPIASELRPTRAVTIEASVLGGGGSLHSLVLAADALTPAFQLQADDGAAYFAIRVGGGEPLGASAPVNWADGQWHHVTGTFDGQKAAIFVDGQAGQLSSPASGDITYPSTTVGLVIGPGDVTTTAVDRIRDVKLYADARSSDQILADAKSSIVPAELPLPTDTLLLRGKGENVFAPLGKAAFSVSDKGEALYHVPLWVPPGRAGVQPDLSLDYSSRAGNGWLGVGWQLSGLSRIERCSKPHAMGDVSPPISLDSRDGYCLDGQPLVPVNSDGSEFRLFHDAHARIRLLGTDGAGPLGFRIEAKSGRIVTLGGTPDSRVEFNAGRARLAWGESREEDRSGNFLTVTYRASAGGEILPSRIDYTGSLSDPSTHRSVFFSYDSQRSDIQDGYVALAHVTRPERLSGITMVAPSALGDAFSLRHYLLNYDSSALTGRSLLTSIAECDGRDSKARQCHSSTFQYSPGSAAFTDAATDSAGASISDVLTSDNSTRSPRLFLADVNGDGRDDLLYRPASNPAYYHLRFSTGDSFGPDQITPIPGRDDSEQRWMSPGPFVLDFDGDGHADVLAQTGDSQDPHSTLFLARPLGNGTWGFVASGMTYGYQQVEVADFNGDRYPDLLMMNQPPPVMQNCQATSNGHAKCEPPDTPVTDVVYSFNTNGVWQQRGPILYLPQKLSSGHHLVDLNSDGAADILYSPIGCTSSVVDIGNHLLGFQNGPLSSTSFADLEFCNDPNPPNPTADDTLIAPFPITGVFGDFNGDGLIDQFQSYTDGSGIDYGVPGVAHGSFLVNQGFQNFLPTGGEHLFTERAPLAARAVDLNLDGQSDILVREVDRPTMQVFSLQNGNTLIQRTDLPVAFNSDLYETDNPLDLFEVGDVNGDGVQDVVMFVNGRVHLLLHSGGKPDLLTNVSAGLGPQSAVSYKPFVGPDDAADCKLPIHCVTGGAWVVDTVSVDNGIGGLSSYQHAFQNGRVDTLQWGFLGFRSHTIYDLQSGTTTNRQFDLSANNSGPIPFYPTTGVPSAVSERVIVNGAGKATNRFSYRTTQFQVVGSGPYTVNASSTQEGVTERVVGSRVETTISEHLVESQTFDDYGNVTQRVEAWPLTGESQVTETSYDNRPDSWLISQPQLVTITASNATESVTRSVGYAYDPRGLVVTRIDNPGAQEGADFAPLPPQPDGVQTLYTEYFFNSDGLPETIITEDTRDFGSQRRLQALGYDQRERMFQVYQSNGLGHVTQQAYEPGLGVVAAKADENGLVTTFQYDIFGRIRSERPPTGDTRTVSYVGATSTSGNTVQDHRAGKPLVVTSLDSLQRVVQTATSGRSDGQVVFTTTDYDARGNTQAVSLPHFAADPLTKTVTSYDELNRPVSISYADGALATNRYQGLTTTFPSTTGNLRAVTEDSRGRTVRVVEGVNPGDLSHPVTTTLDYGPFGELERVTDTKGNVVQTYYDRVGRPRIVLDPDTGAELVSYDAFGQATDRVRGGTWDGTNVNDGITLHRAYDELGRVTAETAPDFTRTTTWDAAAHGVGKMATETSPDASVTFTYDPLSRLSSKQFQVADHNATFRYGYDAYNRENSLTYPAIAGQAPLTINKSFSGSDIGGDLVSIREAVGATPYWTRVSASADERFGVTRLSNGALIAVGEDPSHPGWVSKILGYQGPNLVQDLAYTRDGHGRVRRIADAMTGETDDYTYDGLERLTHWSATTSKGPRAVRYDYDDIGNLVTRAIEAGPGTSTTYTFDAGLGPHQASGNGTNGFAYDERGNQVTLAGRDVTYNGLDLPTSVTTAAGEYDYQYGPDSDRLARTDPAGNVRYSFDGMFELERRADGDHYRELIRGDRPVAQIETVVQEGVVTSVHTTALMTNDLGSIETALGDSDGVQRNKYDPFGNRVAPSDPANPGNASPSGLRVGFTGQAHEDDLGLIDMVGRMYDPSEQRFLTRDPVSPNPTSSQALNRYGYVTNNPLNATDPTGHYALYMDGELINPSVDGEESLIADGFQFGETDIYTDFANRDQKESKYVCPTCSLLGQDPNHGFSLAPSLTLAPIPGLTPPTPPASPDPYVPWNFAQMLNPLSTMMAGSAPRNAHILWIGAILSWSPTGEVVRASPKQIALATELQTDNIHYGTCLEAARINAFLGVVNGYDVQRWNMYSYGKPIDGHAVTSLQDSSGVYYLSWGVSHDLFATIQQKLANWYPNWQSQWAIPLDWQDDIGWQPTGWSDMTLLTPDFDSK